MTNPILFGDYIKMGAAESDKMYEELTDMTKLKNVLNDVSQGGGGGGGRDREREREGKRGGKRGIGRKKDWERG